MAEKTIGQLTTNIENDLADNNAGNISARDVRQNMLDTVDSILPIVRSGVGMTDSTGFLGSVQVGVTGSETGGILKVTSGVQFSDGSTQYSAFPGLGSIEHSGLAGLTAGDPHTQYVHTDGSRDITGNMGLRGWVSESGIVNQGIKFDDDNSLIKIGNVADATANPPTNTPTTLRFERDSSTLDSAKGVARAWMKWTGTSGVDNSGIAVLSAHNIHTLTRVSIGKWQITFPSGTFSDNNYVSVGNSNGRGDDDSAEDFDMNVVGMVANSGTDAPLLRGMTYQVKNLSNQYVNAAVNTLVVYGNGTGTTSASGDNITIVDDLP